MLEKILKKLKEHEKWRRNSINLIASENVMSPLAEKYYLNDFMHRYSERISSESFYQGTKYIVEVEFLVEKMFSNLLGSKFCDIRPISGTLANYAVFKAFKRKNEGNKIAIVPLSAGGHISHKFGPKNLGYKVIELPWNEEEINVDLDKAEKILEKERPNLIVLGASLYTFPHPIREIKEIADGIDAVVIHDSAHVLGLIAGKQFPNPINYDIIITSSTHKTFPGPQGGVIFWNQENYSEKISLGIFPNFTSNYHMHRYIPLAITIEEMRRFGEEYAKQIIRNAKTLAEELYNFGFKVLGENKGFTETHQVVVDVREFGGGDYVARRLEEANIILNKNMLYGDKDPNNPSGIRIGVQEMTRFGMKEDEMREIARFIKEVIIDGKDPKEVKKKVIEFRKEFQVVHYSLPEDWKPLEL